MCVPCFFFVVLFYYTCVYVWTVKQYFHLSSVCSYFLYDFFFRGSYEKAKSWIKIFFSVFGKMLQWYFFCCKGHDRQLWIIWVGKFYYFYIIFIFNTNKYIFNNIVKKRWCDYRKIARVRSLHTQNFICFNYTSCIPFLHHFPSSLGYKQEFVSTCTHTNTRILSVNVRFSSFSSLYMCAGLWENE